jgi:hypothetical protein
VRAEYTRPEFFVEKHGAAIARAHRQASMGE